MGLCCRQSGLSRESGLLHFYDVGHLGLLREISAAWRQKECRFVVSTPASRMQLLQGAIEGEAR